MHTTIGAVVMLTILGGGAMVFIGLFMAFSPNDQVFKKAMRLVFWGAILAVVPSAVAYALHL